MKTLNEQNALSVPICLVGGDFSALLHMEKMKSEGIPVCFNTKNVTLYTDSEEHAQKARYLLFKPA